MKLLLFLTTTCLALLYSTPSAAQVQSKLAQGNLNRANAVKASFQSSFNDYLNYAKGADELLPLSKGQEGGLGNWGATYIDALTTAHVMGYTTIVNEGLGFIQSTNFDNTSQATISLFETNIRYVASLLSLYELTGKKNQYLIKQAQVIGDHLLTGWVGDNAIPFNTLQNWNNYGAPDETTGAIIAEGGTLLLEFSRLSKYSGNKTYLEHAEKSMKAIINSKAVFPGLYGQGIDPTTNTPSDTCVTWGGGSDSFFEYLIKYGILIGSTKTWIPTWVNSVKSSISHIITKAGKTRANVTYLSDYNKQVIPKFSHLGCFAAGNWVLGGKVLGSQGILNYGLQLVSGCINTYTSSVTGIGPEVFVYKTSGGGTNQVSIYDEAFYNQHGFNYQIADYVLRPEVLESVFYAYRITGDMKWQNLAWDAFNNIVKHCKAPAALAGINFVNSTNVDQIDDSESFLYAELYKYLFLIFDDPSNISLDKYVFNTEGHPFLLENPKADYSSVKVGQLPTPLPQPGSSIATTTTPDRTHTAPVPLISGLSNETMAKSLIKRHSQIRQLQRLIAGRD